MTARKEVLPGQKFGRLTVVSEVEKDNSKYGFRRFLVRCECGNEKTLRSYNLFSGDSTSCGCYKLEKAAITKTKHGKVATRIYSIWRGMKERCDNPHHKTYNHYGGRGISYDPRWKNFQPFYDDMFPGYSDHLTLDRIDSDGNYCKENCRWATWSEQNLNKKRKAA